jgi:hypothetical protein
LREGIEGRAGRRVRQRLNYYKALFRVGLKPLFFLRVLRVLCGEMWFFEL